MKTLIIIFFVIFTFDSFGVDLEDVEKGRLFDSKICFYPGSFDPFHEGHEFMVGEALEGVCDYVLIYPSFGGDDYKPDRSALVERQKKLYEIYGRHEKVLLTKMTPLELYEYFKEKRDFVALVGSDVARWLMEDKKMAHEFATGVKPSANNTWGGCVAVYADSFVIFLRGESRKDEFTRTLLDRDVIEIIESPKGIRGISSTKIRQNNIQK